MLSPGVEELGSALHLDLAPVLQQQGPYCSWLTCGLTLTLAGPAVLHAQLWSWAVAVTCALITLTVECISEVTNQNKGIGRAHV